MQQPAQTATMGCMAASDPKPRATRIAALIADPTRSRMLVCLLGGEARTAGELAHAAGITARAVGSLLAELQQAGLARRRPQGRHAYFVLADAELARALRHAGLAAASDPVAARWQRPTVTPLKHARRCYGHLAGELGVAQLHMLLARGHLAESQAGFTLTPTGQQWLATLRLAHPPARGRLAYRCLDWSERQDHLAGTLASALLDHYLEQGWLRADPDSRALHTTRAGEARLLPMLEV